MASLVTGLGGSAGFGEGFLAGNDDGSTAFIDLRSIFPNGINFFGNVYNGVYLNNNGSVTFTASLSTYTPTAITGDTSRPIIAPYWADVDTRGGAVAPTTGGASTGTNLVWWDIDTATNTFTATWDDVGYYGSRTDKLNAFQLQITRVGVSDFNVTFRYEDINWTTGDASGGSGGLGGTPARAGYSAGDGLNFFELPQSGSIPALLDLESASNVGDPGRYVFEVRNGTPEFEVSVLDASVQEGTGAGRTDLVFDVVLSSPRNEAVSVDYVLQPGTAAANGDYLPAGGTITFLPGETRQTIRVEIVRDAIVEADEIFTLQLSNPQNATLGDGIATGRIVNDDGMVIDDASVVEGTGAGATTATFTVRLLAASTQQVTVNYATVNGTAIAGADYTAGSGTLAFAPGETTKTITVQVARDATVEADETFQVRLSGATNAAIADAIGVGTIRNDDGLVVDDVAVLEGTSAGATAVFNVRLLSAAATTVTVNYATANGTAIAGSDYTATSGTLTFAPGETSKTVSVAIRPDAVVEPNEAFRLLLSGATGTQIVDASATGTVRNDDGLIIGDATLVEGTGGATTAQFQVTLQSAATVPVTVQYATRNGTAVAGTDYTATSGTLTFAPGETTKTINVAVNPDATPEATERFFVDLSSPTNSGILTGTGVGTIVNDDGLSISDAVSVTEGTGAGTTTATFTVSLAAAATQTVTVGYRTVDGTAIAGADYTARSGTLTFAPGETTKTVTVNVARDAIDEPNERFRVELFNPVNSAIVDGSGSVLVEDDDAPRPIISIGDVRMSEGTGAGTTEFRFAVALAAPAAGTVTVNYATAPGTATAPADFTAATGTLTFAPGETRKEVVVNVARDALAEANETFFVNLSNPTGGATIADGQGAGTILNDDVTLRFERDLSQVEGNSGATGMTFRVLLSGTSPVPVTVNYATANGTATAGSDYTAKTGTLTFAPGETVKSIVVPVLGDLAVEANETFTVNLSGASGAVIADSRAVGTIVNDDRTLRVSDLSVVEGNGGMVSAVFTVSLSAAAAAPVSVQYATANGSAVAGTDYVATSGTLTFAAGETTKTVAVVVKGDLLVELNETFFLNLSNPSGAAIADGQGVATILNDDVARLAISDRSIIEADRGSAAAVFTVTMSNPSASAVTVNYATANGTATAGADFTAASGQLTFAPGQTSKTVAVAVRGDIAMEANETFFVNLSNAVGGTIGDAQGQGTVVNNDFVGTAINNSFAGTAARDRMDGGLGNDLLNGGGGNDLIRGGGGDDSLTGGLGNDTLEGCDGIDLLIGGAGRDILSGGAGADRFDFDAIADSPTGTLRDVIVDFAPEEGDRIDLATIDARTTLAGDQPFAFIGAAAFTGVAGQLRYGVDGLDTLVEGDVNGDRAADFQILLLGSTQPLLAADFVL